MNLSDAQNYDPLINILNNMVSVSITDKDGLIIYANDFFCELCGYTKEEVLGKNHSFLKSGEHSKVFYENLWHTITSGHTWRGEIKNKAKNGDYYWVDTAITPILNSDQQIDKYISIRLPITEKKHYEEQLLAKNDMLENTNASMKETLLNLAAEKKKALDLAQELEKFKRATDSTSEHVIITDAEGTIMYANKAAEILTGFAIEEIIGKKAGARELWGGLMDEEFYKSLWQTIKVEKKNFTGEIVNRRKSGTIYTAYATISPVIDANGEVNFFIGVERDITHEKEIDKAKTEFVSLASHQLRTPLTAINWYTELLKSDKTGQLTKTQIDYITEIENGSKRMVELVAALLNVSRIELGSFSINPAPTNLISLVRSVLDELKILIDNKNLKITIASDELPLVSVDPKLYRIVYQNLLTNAVKYTPHGGEIKISHTFKDGSVLVTISDNGYGIPHEAKSKIFTKLYRADNVITKDTQGTGLGLYITKSIVENSKGKIWFESEEDRGTTFYISIPTSGSAKVDSDKALE